MRFNFHACLMVVCVWLLFLGTGHADVVTVMFDSGDDEHEGDEIFHTNNTASTLTGRCLTLGFGAMASLLAVGPTATHLGNWISRLLSSAVAKM